MKVLLVCIIFLLALIGVVASPYVYHYAHEVWIDDGGTLVQLDSYLASFEADFFDALESQSYYLAFWRDVNSAIIPTKEVRHFRGGVWFINGKSATVSQVDTSGSYTLPAACQGASQIEVQYDLDAYRVTLSGGASHTINTNGEHTQTLAMSGNTINYDIQFIGDRTGGSGSVEVTLVKCLK